MLDGVGTGAEDSKRLIAHFPAAAVGAVEEVTAPAFVQARDLRQLVCRPGRDQQPSCTQRLAVREADREGGVDRDDVAGDELDSVRSLRARRSDPSRSRSCSPSSGSPRSTAAPPPASDDPYSEAQFTTLKYRPEFPARFGSIEQARQHCRTFFRWYNHAHRHAGVGLMTPAAVHHGQARLHAGVDRFGREASHRARQAPLYETRALRTTRWAAPSQVETGRADEGCKRDRDVRYTVRGHLLSHPR